MRRRLEADRGALAVLVVALAALTAISWRRWGNPAYDAGTELTVADLVAHGVTPYSEIRYFYGPLGLYALAGSFRVFGSTLAVAWALGYVQTVAILGAFYALARQWLRVATACVATLVLSAIAFSGTEFAFVLPHTNSAT